MSRKAEPPPADHAVDPDFDPLAPDYLADPCFARRHRSFYAPGVDFWVAIRAIREEPLG